MKRAIEKMAVHSRLLAKSLAAAKYLKKGDSYRRARRIITDFCPIEKQCDRPYLRKLILDLIFSTIYHRISMLEYFLYRFEGKTETERHAYIGNIERLELCDQIGDIKAKKILLNKYDCYCFFQKYYGRDVIKISGPEDEKTFQAFFSEHEEIIIKPIDQSSGNGIYRVNGRVTGGKEAFQSLLPVGVCVIEEYIKQHVQLAQFHPQSVNTIRIATFCDAGMVEVLFAALRVGKGESIVDNAGAGGIFASVNTATGIIQSDGYAENGKVYQAHPETGRVFKGFQVPRWQELLDIALTAARMLPQQNYISWDLALTDCGWIMVEANYQGVFVITQMTEGGIRERFMRKFEVYKNAKNRKTSESR